MHNCLLHVDFLAGPQDGHQGYARLEIELPFCPVPTIELEHPVWHEAQTPLRVTYNLESGTFYVVLPTEELQTTDAVAAQKEIYAHHGWTVH